MKPTLVILAAGMGSRYGSLKQIDTIGPSGERIIDYSIYDAVQAGFGKIVLIIRKEFEKDFKEVILKELPSNIEVELVYQELDNIPDGVSYPKKRKKPWGTGHALLMVAPVVKEPFVVINADDFYGAESFKTAANFLALEKLANEYGIVGYKLKNTLSEFGTVSRGVCESDDENYLISIVERTKIKIANSKVVYEGEDNKWQSFTGNEIVSMNMFAFTPTIFTAFEEGFKNFLNNNKDNITAEFFMPTVVSDLIKANEAKVKVLESNASWFGLTYSEDKPMVKAKLAKLAEDGTYPKKLWT